MGKHTDKLGTYDDFKAPWETEAGTDAEIDKPKLRRLIFNLKLGEAKALDNADEAKEKVTAAETERDEAKADAEKASPDEANKKIARLEKENADLKAEKTAREEADAHEALRKEVLGDLDPKYAKYVVGKDKKELEESLEAVKADFGIKDGEPGDDDDDDDENVIRSTPRTRLKNVADRSTEDANGAVDFDKVADEALGNNIFG